MQKTSTIIQETIAGSRTLSNILIVCVLFVAGICFCLVGVSTFLKENLLPLTDTTNLTFIPQGITMLFYGILAIIVGGFLLVGAILNVGSGYNEFSKKDRIVRIVRKGFFGKNKLIYLTYPFTSIKKLKIEFKQGVNPRNNIFLILKDQREIPLYPSQIYIPIATIEKKAIELADFLNVPIENIG